MDPIARKKRELNYGRNDNLLGELYVDKIKAEFPKIKKRIPFVIIDALRTQTDPGEENIFVDSKKKLWQCLYKAPSLRAQQFEENFEGCCTQLVLIELIKSRMLISQFSQGNCAANGTYLYADRVSN